MARFSTKKLTDWTLGVALALTGIAVGEQFLSGTFLNGIVLGILPEVIHTIAGWITIAGGILGIYRLFTKR